MRFPLELIVMFKHTTPRLSLKHLGLTCGVSGNIIHAQHQFSSRDYWAEMVDSIADAGSMRWEITRVTPSPRMVTP